MSAFDLDELRADVEYLRKLGPLESQHEVVNAAELDALLREAEAGRRLRERISCNCRVCFSCIAAAEYDAAVGVE